MQKLVNASFESTYALLDSMADYRDELKELANAIVDECCENGQPDGRDEPIDDSIYQATMNALLRFEDINNDVVQAFRTICLLLPYLKPRRVDG